MDGEDRFLEYKFFIRYVSLLHGYVNYFLVHTNFHKRYFIFHFSIHFNLSSAEANSNNNNTNTVISPNHLETFFEENNAKMLRFQHDIEDMSIQLVKERAIVGDLNGTIDELKEELEKAQGNILTISTLKDALESQQQRTNETLRIQVRKIRIHSICMGYFSSFIRSLPR